MRDKTLGEVFDGFRFKPGDVVMHKSATGTSAFPAPLVVLGRELHEGGGGFSRAYVVRGVMERADGVRHLDGSQLFFDCELEPYTPPTRSEWAERLAACVRKPEPPAESAARGEKDN